MLKQGSNLTPQPVHVVVEKVGQPLLDSLLFLSVLKMSAEAEGLRVNLPI